MTVKDIKQSFAESIDIDKLRSTGDQVLVGCSGGVDSMVLCHLLFVHNLIFHVGHVNYQLRGSESEQDEYFVRQYCQKYFIPYHLHRVSSEPAGNLQSWARTIRYDYYEKIAQEENINTILVAHHFDDEIETFILNFNRGTGLAGLVGISKKRGKIYRPLLFARKSQLISYAKKNNLSWRTDSTNAEDIYSRNLIRHQIVPVLDSIRGHDQGMKNTISELKKINTWVNHHLNKQLDRHFYNGNEWRFRISEIKNEDELFEFTQMLRILNFHRDQVKQLMASVETGKKIYSSDHLAVRDRELIRIRKQIQNIEKEQRINFPDQPTRYLIGPFEFHLKVVPLLKISKSNDCIHLHMDSIHWPLTLRQWKRADRFKPYGMYGKTKKVSDLITFLKLSPFEKDETLVLADARETILWVVGRRRAIHHPIPAKYIGNVIEINVLRLKTVTIE